MTRAFCLMTKYFVCFFLSLVGDGAAGAIQAWLSTKNYATWCPVSSSMVIIDVNRYIYMPYSPLFLHSSSKIHIEKPK